MESLEKKKTQLEKEVIDQKTKMNELEKKLRTY
jgi:hypothetical protein